MRFSISYNVCMRLYYFKCTLYVQCTSKFFFLFALRAFPFKKLQVVIFLFSFLSLSIHPVIQLVTLFHQMSRKRNIINYVELAWHSSMPFLHKLRLSAAWNEKKTTTHNPKTSTTIQETASTSSHRWLFHFNFVSPSIVIFFYYFKFHFGLIAIHGKKCITSPTADISQSTTKSRFIYE